LPKHYTGVEYKGNDKIYSEQYWGSTETMNGKMGMTYGEDQPIENYDLEKIKKSYETFYERGMWSHMGGKSISGLGSSKEYTKNFSGKLIEIISKYNIKKTFDCSCGDWFWMKEIKDNFQYYVGNDITSKLIESNKQNFESHNIKFVCNDFISQLNTYKDNEFDLIICRHTLEHLPYDYNEEGIKEIKRVSKYAIITSSNGEGNEKNIRVDENWNGESRCINLDESPYLDLLGKPIFKFWDSIGEESSIGCFGYLYDLSGKDKK
jgi:hypothetical protein